MLGILRTVGWLAGIVYSTIPLFWLMIHSRAEYWRSRRRSPYLLLVPVWVAIWLVLAMATWRWRQLTLYRTPWAWLPAGLLFLLSFWIYRRSAAAFSRAQLSGLPEIVHRHPEQRLITSGIRARVRHPVYLAHLCELLAWTMGTGLLVLFLLTSVGILGGAAMIRGEDAELDRRFGDQYRTYRRRVPALLPRF